MKKIIFITCCLIASLLTRGQEYVPIVDTTRTWNVAEIYPHGGGATTFEYFFGKTLYIEDTLYVEIMAKSYNQGYLKGYLREDTISRKVYYRNIFAKEPTLLYDFSLEIDDTVILYGENGFKYTVLEIDSVEIFRDDFRKKIVFSGVWHSENLVWVEGIGNITFNLLNPGDLEEGTINTVLLCCYENDELAFMNDTYNTCYLDWVNVKESNNTEIKVFPNPAQNHITVTGGSIEDLEINIYNLHGLLLLEKQVENHETIDISHLDPGIIFVRVIKNTNKFSSFKIIKL
jgi:hypothetical protein